MRDNPKHTIYNERLALHIQYNTVLSFYYFKTSCFRISIYYIANMPRPRLSSVERQRRKNQRLVNWRARIPSASAAATPLNHAASPASLPFIYVQPGSTSAQATQERPIEPYAIETGSSDTRSLEQLPARSPSPIEPGRDSPGIDSYSDSNSIQTAGQPDSICLRISLVPDRTLS